MAYPLGEAKFEPLRAEFERRLKLEFHGSDISSDAGLLPYLELDDALGLTELGGEVLSETRRRPKTRQCRLRGTMPSAGAGHRISRGHARMGAIVLPNVQNQY